MTSLATRKPGCVVSVTLTTGGSGYTAQPTVTFSGGGGTGAAAVAHMAGTMVDSIVLTNAGTGYTSQPTVTVDGNAQATAHAYTGSARPAVFFRSRFNDLYAVDGMGRGLRWNGSDGQMQPIGISKPSTGPAVTALAGTDNNSVTSIDIIRSGAGYSSTPTITLTGGSPTKPASAIASVKGGRVSSVIVTDAGSGYSSAPVVKFSGGCASGCSLTVGVAGALSDIQVVSGGSGYTAAPTVTLSTEQGLTQANAIVDVVNGSVVSAVVLAAGTGATTTGVTAKLTGGGGAGASIRPIMAYSVKAVTVATSGTGFYAEPMITFQPQPSDVSYATAAATASINTSGNVSSVTVTSGGRYSAPPTAVILDGTAVAAASLTPRMSGKYKCCIRYLDSTPESQRGPIPSSISDLVEVDAGQSASQITWAFAHAGIEDRVSAMELWRTTSEQSVVLFRVATIQRTDPQFFGSYTDSLSDKDLQDTTRDGYGLMPVTLPSGQINARRFDVPPGNYGVAVMFQDRAWYAVDTTGEKPNSLLFSEVDEPESVPASNELVVQESTGDSDAVVALIPLSSSLVIAQRRHLYKLQYVAQPILDASVLLGAYRGILTSRCWDVLGGVAFIVDSYGMYAYDGNQESPVSAPVDDMWRTGQVDFSQASKFHVKADHVTKIVRFFFCRPGDTDVSRALCYCVSTKAWWEEEYPQPVTAGANMAISGRQDVVYGTGSGGFLHAAGYSDDGDPIEYRMRTGSLELANVDKGSRSVGVLYTPTADDAEVTFALHYNGSSSPRPNAISSDRGDGFVSIRGSTGATLNLKAMRSPLGDASGYARAYYAGNVDDRSAGSDRHVAISIAGTQSTQGNAVVLHAVTMEGVVG